MANALRSEFMGKTLKSSQVATAPRQQKFQVNALFKKAQKQVNKADATAKKLAPAAPGKATQIFKQAQRAVKKQAPAKPQNVFNQAKKAQKKAAASIPSGKGAGVPKRTKGWLGEAAGGAQNLDKWYGKFSQRVSTQQSVTAPVHSFVCNRPWYAVAP